MAQIAKTEAEKATDNVAELGKRTTDKAVDVAHEVANKAEDTVRRGFQTAQKTAGAATEVGQVFAELVNEQVRNNVETFQALSRTLDWKEAAQIHGDFLRASVERAAEFTRRYFEVVQAGGRLHGFDGPGAGSQDGLTRLPPWRRRSLELDERHGRAPGSGHVRSKTVRPFKEPKWRTRGRKEPLSEHVAERGQCSCRKGPQCWRGGGETSADQLGQADSPPLEWRLAG